MVTMGESRQPDRKTLQLCRQVQKALTYALGETGDELLLLVRRGRRARAGRQPYARQRSR
jgi:hypothetical protein